MRRFMPCSIRLQLTFGALLLVAVPLVCIWFFSHRLTEHYLRGELLKRGFSLSRSGASAAAFGVMANDRLALDTLVAKMKEGQADIRYAAVVGTAGTYAAHSSLEKSGSRHLALEGEEVSARNDGSRVVRTPDDGHYCYDFCSPIRFAGKNVGQFHVVIEEAVLLAAQQDAARQVAIFSGIILILSVGSATAFSSSFVRPIVEMTDSVRMLQQGELVQPVRARKRHDELGELANTFAEMGQVIVLQQEKLREYARSLEESYYSTVRILALAIDARDDYTLQHSTRVAAMAVEMGRELGLSKEELRDLEVAALVHDLGKIRVPDHILQKPARLDRDEAEKVQKHPLDGAEILSYATALRKFIPAVLHHHERHDGTGYPEGLAGDDIPLFASIIAVADAFDAMTSTRQYRKALPVSHAVEEIAAHSGRQFNPKVADSFLKLITRTEVPAEIEAT